MKTINSLLFAAVVAAALAGCATSSYQYGRNFDASQVSKIVRGKTTAAEVRSMFGAPYRTSVLSPTRQEWVYTFASGKAHATSYLFTADVKSTGRSKRLIVMLENGVVTQYSYSDSGDNST